MNAGGQINFFVNTTDPQYILTIYRLGYYGGLGGRQMTKPVTLHGMAQPVPTPDPTFGMAECQWTNPYVFKVPANWVSGLSGPVDWQALGQTALHHIRGAQ